MRPRSETREALARAADHLATAGTDARGASYYAMARQAAVPAHTARWMVRDMARAGELVPCGTEKLPHARKPAIAYVPRHLEHRAALGLVDITRGWTSASHTER